MEVDDPKNNTFDATMQWEAIVADQNG